MLPELPDDVVGDGKALLLGQLLLQTTHQLARTP